MFKRTLLAQTAMLALISIAPSQATILDRDVTRVKSLAVSGDRFTDHLAREYRDFSIFESAEMYDWPDADHFAEKAFAAAASTTPAPERVGDWNIDGADHRAELDAARGELMAAFDQGARSRAPSQAAIAQARFDCWVEQQEEAWQTAHIAACRTQFHQAMANLRTAMAPPPAEPVAKKAEPKPAEPRLIATTEAEKVFFDFDKSDITAEAQARIDRFVASIRDRSAVEIVVEGHADRAGPADYNRALSERRAEAVRQELIRQGLRISTLNRFEMEAKGESAPAVITGDGVAEPRNRRVVIQGFGYTSDPLAKK